MKKDIEHWVYLSAQAVEMLHELQTLTHSQRFLFPMRHGYEDRPIAKSTPNQAVRAMKTDVQHFVIHDFRRTSLTYLHEMGMSSDQRRGCT
jgi:integrase